MSKLFFPVLVILFSLNTALGQVPSTAIEGNEGGGGDQLIVEFVSMANRLIEEDLIDGPDKLILEKSLDSTRIVIVQVLKNPVTGAEIPNQSTLVAWGSPNLVQLKVTADRSHASWDRLSEDEQSLAQYVFHELYRASGVVDTNGNCPDETFQLSIGKYRLNEYHLVNIPAVECKEQNRIVLESYVLRTTKQQFGSSAKIKISSKMSFSPVTNYDCLYEVFYMVTAEDSSGSKKEILGHAQFDNKFHRPRYEVQLPVSE